MGGRSVRVGDRVLRGSGLSPGDGVDDLVEGRTVAAAPWDVLRMSIKTLVLSSLSGTDTTYVYIPHVAVGRGGKRAAIFKICTCSQDLDV